MELPRDDVVQFEEAVMRAQKIFITPHKSPDGDALGASLALYIALSRAGRDVTIGCVDPVPETFRFLPSWERIVASINPDDYDLVISVDAGDIKQLGWDKVHPSLFDGSKTLIKIDHHAFAQEFGDIRLVYTDLPASCAIVTKLLIALGIRIRPDMATNLLNGLYTDTGSFKHSNTTPDVLKMAAHLMRLGANLPAISKRVFHTVPVSAMRLWGRVLRDMQLTKKGVSLAIVRERDFTETGTSAEDMTGVVDYVNAVPEARFSLLLSERGDVIKGSLRTLRDDVNVAKIASAFGGGGHVKAAGFAVPGTLAVEQRWSIVSEM